MRKVYWLFETVFQSISSHLPEREMIGERTNIKTSAVGPSPTITWIRS